MDKTATSKIRVILADDHLVVRMGLASVLSFEKDIKVIGEADNGKDAVKMALELKPDVVLMDLQMPGLTGAEATAEIHAANENIKVLILTTFASSAEIRRAIHGGAAGALVKSSSQDEIIGAIRSVASGAQVLSPEIRNTLRDISDIPDLSPRQIEILNLVAKGFSNKEIAQLLNVTLETVKDHIKRILQSLGATSRAEAVTIALNFNLLANR